MEDNEQNNILSIQEFLEWYENLPILCYGEISDDEILDNFKQILKWKNEQIFISEKIPDNKFTILEYWLMLGLLHNCIEYGTSPRGAWLNDFGIKLLNFLDGNFHVELLKDNA